MKKRVERPLRISCVREVRLMTEELNFHDMAAFHKRSVSSGGNSLRIPSFFSGDSACIIRFSVLFLQETEIFCGYS